MGKPPIYDRAALKLTNDEHKKYETDGINPHWRFLLDKKKVTWKDKIIGDVTIDLASLSDPVFVKEDGQFLYTLASVCDDIDFNITNVIRGDDHTSNTAVQIELINALDKNNLVFGTYA